MERKTTDNEIIAISLLCEQRSVRLSFVPT